MTSLFASLLRGRARRRTITDLMRLDDHLLADIGITRSELHAMLRGDRRTRT
jgi:uncharacterized protein YjiS (DUF1127 family)